VVIVQGDASYSSLEGYRFRVHLLQLAQDFFYHQFLSHLLALNGHVVHMYVARMVAFESSNIFHHICDTNRGHLRGEIG
jgi:hypothetical protein